MTRISTFYGVSGAIAALALCANTAVAGSLNFPTPTPKVSVNAHTPSTGQTGQVEIHSFSQGMSQTRASQGGPPPGSAQGLAKNTTVNGFSTGSKPKNKISNGQLSLHPGLKSSTQP